MFDPDIQIPVKILLVDDEGNILSSLKRLLMDEGWDILTASSGAKALEILRQEKDTGLIISDQRMPGMSGTEFLEQAKHIQPLAMRILLTGYSDIQAAIEAINRGGAGKYLTKPWKDEEIVQVVREACQRYELIRKNQALSEAVRKQNEELKSWSQELEIRVQEQTIELSRQNEELEKLNINLRANFKSTILALASLIELRDKRVRNHSRMVAEVAGKTAFALNLPRDECETIIIAAFLHDIGKIGLSDVLLAKDEERFNPDEAKEYQLHSIRGQSAVDGIVDLRDAGLLIRHHHEAYDGSGFPDGLKGEKIPLGSRIIALADHVDHSVNRGMDSGGIKKVLGGMKDGLGKRFDLKIFNSMSPAVETVYAGYRTNNNIVEREMDPKQLREGMVIARDVKSGTGLMLCSRGLRLTTGLIHAIRRYYSIDPPNQGIFIVVEPA